MGVTAFITLKTYNSGLTTKEEKIIFILKGTMRWTF